VEPAVRYALLETQMDQGNQAVEDPRIRGRYCRPWGRRSRTERAEPRLFSTPWWRSIVNGSRGVRRPDPVGNRISTFASSPGFVRGGQVVAGHMVFRSTYASTTRSSAQTRSSSSISVRRSALSSTNNWQSRRSKEHVLDPWREQISRVSIPPETSRAKISGMVTEADHRRWTPKTWRLTLSNVVESFGGGSSALRR